MKGLHKFHEYMRRCRRCDRLFITDEQRAVFCLRCAFDSPYKLGPEGQLNWWKEHWDGRHWQFRRQCMRRFEEELAVWMDAHKDEIDSMIREYEESEKDKG